MKRTLTIEYDDEVLQVLGLSANQFTKETKMLVAIKLYKLGR